MNSNSLKAEQKNHLINQSSAECVLCSYSCTSLYFCCISSPSPWIQKYRNAEIQKYRNTEMQKYRNTETQNAVPVLHGALLLLHGPDLGWVWQRCPQHRRGEALRHRHDAPWLWVAPTKHVLTPELIFWSPPAIWSTHPPVNSHLMLWAGSRIFEVLEFTYYMVNPRTHPVIVTPTGFHCCYSLLLTTTQFNISYATPWKSSGQYCNDIWQNFWLKCWFPSMTSLQNWTSWVRFSGNSRKALGHQWRWKPSYFQPLKMKCMRNTKTYYVNWFPPLSSLSITST